MQVKNHCFILIVILFLFSMPKITLSADTLAQEKLYTELQQEINKSISGAQRRLYPGAFQAKGFMRTRFETIAYFTRRPALLNVIVALQNRYRELFGKLENTAAPKIKPKKAPAKPPKGDNNITSFGYKGLFIAGKIGMDYLYIDPGLLIPENNSVKIANNPYLYYYLNFGIDFHFFDLDFRFKDSFSGDNFSENYINKQDTISQTEEAKSRERYLNLIGFVMPFTYSNIRYGIYLSGSFRLFQAEIDISETTTFTDTKESISLDPADTHIVNIFHASYSFGLSLQNHARYFKYKAAAGFQHTSIDAPYFIQASDTIETVSAQRNGLFILADQEYSSMRFTTNSFYGIARFQRPSGEYIQYNALGVDGDDNFGTTFFYVSSVQNTYEYKWSPNVSLSGYLGYSG
ncbi:MAG: hypothetical protein CVV50_02010, partial [Spirochaetae bacterium HGW-Spirochaetae-6]